MTLNPLHNYRIRTALKNSRDTFKRLLNNRKVAVKCHSTLVTGGGYSLDALGDGHSMEIGEGTWMQRANICIRGRNNRLVFGKDCVIGPECYFSLVGNNLTIIIGSKTTFTRECEVRAEEHDVSVTIGEDCMFSNNVRVRTSDGHSIIDKETGKRLNRPASVKIGNHVWFTPGCRIMKGAEIGDGCIVGTNAIVTKSHPADTLIVGSPARDAKGGVTWAREQLPE